MTKHSKRFAILFLFFIIKALVVLGSGSQALGANWIKIGLLEEPKTLNIWLASDAWSRKVLGQIHDSLYIREPKNLTLVPWLAQGEPEYDKAALSYTVTLRPAQWSDGSPVTARDVVFTGKLIKALRVPGHYSNWNFIKDIQALDQRRIRFVLEEPKATFLSRTLTTPVVQKKQWAGLLREASQATKPLKALLNFKMERPVGTGPFVLKEWKQGAYLFLEKNRHFFGTGKKIGGHVLGPYVDGIVFKFFGTPDAAILALKKGSVDYFWWGIQPGYIEDLLKAGDIRIFSSQKSALYYLGFNLRRRPFDDPALRHAMATMVDKHFIIKRILQGYAIDMDSVVPPGNTFWYCPDLPSYGEGLCRERRIRKAYDILSRAGYTWEDPPVTQEGKVVKGEGIRLPDGRPMEAFTILTPPADYDPHRAMIGIMVQEWLKMIGLPASSRPMGFGALIHYVKTRHDFDLFVLGYGSLSLDPDYLRHFFHSRNDTPRGQNMTGYHNPRFDRVADASAGTLDLEKRRALIHEMQCIIMEDIPCCPLYNPKLVEAVRTDRFCGWVQTLGGIGNTWSLCCIRPK